MTAVTVSTGCLQSTIDVFGLVIKSEGIAVDM
jgi:hypothetical protein